MLGLKWLFVGGFWLYCSFEVVDDAFGDNFSELLVPFSRRDAAVVFSTYCGVYALVLVSLSIEIIVEKDVPCFVKVGEFTVLYQWSDS